MSRKIDGKLFGTENDLIEARIEEQILEKLGYEIFLKEPDMRKRTRLRATLHRASRDIRRELRDLAKEVYEQKRKILIDLAVAQVQSLIDRS